MIKFIFGKTIATCGAVLWQRGGWTGAESYSDLTMFGKLGYNMMLSGMKLMGITSEELKAWHVANQEKSL